MHRLRRPKPALWSPIGYRRQQPVRRPKLDAWVATIDQILEQDKAEGKKQRHTAKRIFERLRDEHSYTGGYTIVGLKDATCAWNGRCGRSSLRDLAPISQILFGSDVPIRDYELTTDGLDRYIGFSPTDLRAIYRGL